jgi:hypothetical protein
MGDIVVASVATMDLPAGRRVDLRRCLPWLSAVDLDPSWSAAPARPRRHAHDCSGSPIGNVRPVPR